MAYRPAPPPKSPLGRYRILSPSASVRVSPLCLGTMNFGESWKAWMGICSKSTAFEILDLYYQQGGNFIDTASNYQNEESETWIGEWMSLRDNRDQLVLATKFSTNYKHHLIFNDGDRVNANYGGNSTKCMHLAVQESLRKLQTTYLDILYLHWWDHATSIPELMLSLNALLNQGKVLYLGVSDSPAWFVAKCNQYARDNGLRGFVVYQGQWSAANRSFERDILSLCEHDGMGIAPWGALGSGEFKSKKQLGAKSTVHNLCGEEREDGAVGGRKPIRPTATSEAVAEVLEKVAEKIGTKITSVALAYVMHKAPYVFPIIGGRKVEQLKDNIAALSLELSDWDIKEIDEAVPFDLGFPFKLTGSNADSNWLMNMRGNYDYVERLKPIHPSKMYLPNYSTS